MPGNCLLFFLAEHFSFKPMTGAAGCAVCDNPSKMWC